MTNFNELITTKKGDYGEQLVDEYLINCGYIIYKPISNNAHSFDRIISYKKERLTIVEIKSKSKRKYFPDTGIDYKFYIEYINKSKELNIPVFLIFVDEESKKVYGNLLSVLCESQKFIIRNKTINYPLIEKDIIYFHMDNMKQLFEITEEQSKQLKQYTTKKY